jgi:F-type H+-transporting ATPase subunit delta
MNKISKNYAKSLFEKLIIESNQESTLSNLKRNINLCLEELSLFSTTILNSKKLQGFFQNPTFSEQKKYEILVTLFPNISELTHSLLKILLEKREIYLLPEIFHEYEKLTLKFSKIKKVKLIVSSYLDKHIGKKLLEKLKKLTKANEIILEVEYKEELLSGLIIQSASAALDASLVEELKSLLKEI